MVANMRVSMSDAMDNFSTIISGHELFKFTEGDIHRMRSEIYNVMAHIRESYRTHRIHDADTSVLLSDSDDEEVAIEAMDECKSDDDDEGSIYESSLLGDDSEALMNEDGDLSVDTMGKCRVPLSRVIYRSIPTQNKNVVVENLFYINR